MLGEAARTEADALRYLTAYADAISSLNSGATGPDIRHNPGISVKLSAIHPRYEIAQKETMLPVMSERLLSLALAARHARMGLNIDAEEADRLDLSLDVIERVLADPSLPAGTASASSSRPMARAPPSSSTGSMRWRSKLDRQIMVRLVKGAYWDTEIKRAQTLGLPGYPVFTRKANTDVSYIAMRAQAAVDDRPHLSAIRHAQCAYRGRDPGDGRRIATVFEFQRLHGMGEALHETVRKAEGTRCRIYAPVGAHSDLLAYLVRRLLENGANSSFVHQITDDDVPAEAIARDPFETVETPGPGRQSGDPVAGRRSLAPAAEFARAGTSPIRVTLAAIDKAKRQASPGQNRWIARPITRAAGDGQSRPVVNPAKPGRCRRHGQ